MKECILYTCRFATNTAKKDNDYKVLSYSGIAYYSKDTNNGYGAFLGEIIVHVKYKGTYKIEAYLQNLSEGMKEYFTPYTTTCERI